MYEQAAAALARCLRAGLPPTDAADALARVAADCTYLLRRERAIRADIMRAAFDGAAGEPAALAEALRTLDHVDRHEDRAMARLAEAVRGLDRLHEAAVPSRRAEPPADPIR